MDIVFDIDGTLANAEHRLHFINDMAFWKAGGVTRDMKPDWDSFLSDEQVAKDTPIPEAWALLTGMLYGYNARVIFITGRPERQRFVTSEWLLQKDCEHRGLAYRYWQENPNNPPALFMRPNDTRAPSHAVKTLLLQGARDMGFDPKIAFEDRKEDAEMWRRNGLLCCHVAEGNY